MYSVRFFQNKIREEIAQRVCRRLSPSLAFRRWKHAGARISYDDQICATHRGYPQQTKQQAEIDDEKRRDHHREREIRRESITSADNGAHHDPDEHDRDVGLEIADANRIDEKTVGGAKISRGVLGHVAIPYGAPAPPAAADDPLHRGSESGCPASRSIGDGPGEVAAGGGLEMRGQHRRAVDWAPLGNGVEIPSCSLAIPRYSDAQIPRAAAANFHRTPRAYRPAA